MYIYRYTYGLHSFTRVYPQVIFNPCFPISKRDVPIPLKDVLDNGRADGLVAQRYAGLPAEQGRCDVVLRRRRDELLQRGEIAQEEALDHVPVDPRQHRPIVGVRRHGQHALHVPQGLKQVEHVVPVLVEELPDEGRARAGGGQQQDVLAAAAGGAFARILQTVVLFLQRVMAGVIPRRTRQLRQQHFEHRHGAIVCHVAVIQWRLWSLQRGLPLDQLVGDPGGTQWLDYEDYQGLNYNKKNKFTHKRMNTRATCSDNSIKRIAQ